MWRTEPDPLRERALARLVARSGGSATHPSSIPASDLGVSPRGTVHMNSYSLVFQAHVSHAWNHKGITTRSSSTESVDSGDLKKDAV